MSNIEEKNENQVESKKSNKFINFLSYVTLVIIALIIFLENILSLVGIEITGAFISTLNTIRNFFILLIVGVAAGKFIPGKAKWIKIVFWVSIGIYALGSILYWFI